MICLTCSTVMMEGDRHKRCILHRRCKSSKPCPLDKDWSELQWKSFNASVEAQKLANKQPKRGASGKSTGSSSKGALSGPGKKTGSSSADALSGSHGMSSISVAATTAGPEATCPVVSEQPSVVPGVTQSGDSTR